MPDWLQVIILGIVEGITEFLPVSSTGHLLLAQQWLAPRSDMFNIVIQSGAVVAVVLIYWQRLLTLGMGWKIPKNRDYLLKLFVAFFITGLGGLILDKAGLELPEEAAPVGIALLVGGILFLVVERMIKGKSLSDEITWKIAIAFGLAQLIAAVFPGASRSGSTILIGLVMGLSRKSSVEFTFLLGVPTLLAAGGYKLLSEIKDHGLEGIEWGMLALGTVVSAVTAFIAVKWLLKFVQTHTFVAFGWYRIALGAAVLLLMR